MRPQMALADGIALADILAKRKTRHWYLPATGGTSEGDFHECAEYCLGLKACLLFSLSKENNGYALSTPVHEQYKGKKLVDKGHWLWHRGFSSEINGNNILDVYYAISEIAANIRQRPRPVLVECMTFRMRAHEEASDTNYVPQELINEWQDKDPVTCFENFFDRYEGVLRPEWIPYLRNELNKQIDPVIEKVLNEPDIRPNIYTEMGDVYRPVNPP